MTDRGPRLRELDALIGPVDPSRRARARRWPLTPGGIERAERLRAQREARWKARRESYLRAARRFEDLRKEGYR